MPQGLEPMEMDDPVNANAPLHSPSLTLPSNHQVSRATLDVEALAASYRGYGKILRLLYVADHSKALKVEALQAAIQHIQSSTANTQMYQTCVARLAAALQDQDAHPPAPGHNGNGADGIPDVVGNMEVGGRGGGLLDGGWLETTTKAAAVKLEKLDSDLKHYKANSIKESIRRGQDELGDAYLDQGDLNNALKCFSRARDYCTSARHILHMCLNVVTVCVYLRNWSLLLSYVARAESLAETSASAAGPNALPPQGPSKEAGAAREATDAKLKFLNTRDLGRTLSGIEVATGLAELANRKYKAAARAFLGVSFAGLDYSEVVSGSAVATMGALCALATFEREELSAALSGSGEFRQFLDLEPWLLQLIRHFQESAYSACLGKLDEERDNLLLDLYLAPHVPSLLAMIRSKALVQYSSVYVTAKLSDCAAAFNTSVERLEEELSDLILQGHIQGRIDSHKKVLHAKELEARSAAFRGAEAAGAAMARRAKALIVRAAAQKARVCVKAKPQRPANPHHPAHPSHPNDGPSGGGGGGGGGSGAGSPGAASSSALNDPQLTPSNSSGHSSPTNAP